MKSKGAGSMFLQFWRTDDGKISLIRDILVAILLVLVLLTALWGYTGQWFSAPMVAIESGSMMHLDEPWGRLGTIDAGDMVLLVKVNGKDDVVTHGGGCDGAYSTRDKDNHFYGDYGDVIIYRKYGDPDAKQIIHRARCWIEVNEDDTYTVSDYCIYNEESITIKELGLKNYKPTHSGFITQGDNPVTNSACDQMGGICDEPIKPEWVTGKARGEIPWIGTINLFFDDLVSGRIMSSNAVVYNVPSDCITCLMIVIAVLISIPVSLDVYDWYKPKDEED